MTAIRSPRRRRLLALAAAIAALLALPLGAAPALAADQLPSVARYVALGDSYAAGQGAGGYVDSCLVSPLGYPGLLDAQPRISLLREPACSGATIGDVTATQLDQVNRGTTLVTITAGANDLGIGQVYAACAPDPTSAGCAQAVSTALTAVPTIGPKMSGLIAAVHTRAPDARIVVTGYPRPYADAAAAMLPVAGLVDTAADELDAQLAGAVQAQASGGVSVAFAAVSFGEHAIGGSAVPWIGGDPTDPVTFFHPTAAGYAAYRDAVLAVLP